MELKDNERYSADTKVMVYEYTNYTGKIQDSSLIFFIVKYGSFPGYIVNPPVYFTCNIQKYMTTLIPGTLYTTLYSRYAVLFITVANIPYTSLTLSTFVVVGARNTRAAIYSKPPPLRGKQATTE